MAKPIQVLERRQGLVPSIIQSQDKIIEIDAVSRCWTEMTTDHSSAFYHFQVRCGQRWYQLSENVKTGLWFMQAHG
ncbi:MAG: hypothetical protein AAF629_28390 [Chloroflexota bacterium]